MELYKRDVIKLVGLTEKQIEKCEDAGVAIKPEDKNQHGHFIYSDQHIDRLWQIKLCYLMGYEIKEMKEIFLKQDYDREKMLDIQITRLEEDIRKKKELLQMAQAMKTTGITLEMLPHHTEMFAGYKFDEIYEIVRQTVSKYNEDSNCMVLTEELDCEVFEDDFNKLMSEVEGIFSLENKGYGVASRYVQRRVEKIITILSCYIPKSVYFIKLLSVLLMPESRVAEVLDKEYGGGKGRYLYNAVLNYIEESEEREDPFLYSACVIECMAEERTRLNEERVFAVLDEVYEKLTGTMMFGEEYKRFFFKKIMNGHVGKREAFDERFGEGVAEFVLGIVERYLER